ncbi:hypothetical protein EMCRGX_G034651 [Ephydatia muelleri]
MSSKAPPSYDPPSSDSTSPAPSIFAYSTPKHHASRYPLGVERPMSPLTERPMSPFFARTQLQIAVKSGSDALSAATSTASAVGSRPHCPTAKVAPLGTSGPTSEPRMDQLQASVDLDEKERIRKLTETLGQLGISPARSDSRLGSESGWKGVLEMKDRILNQKSQLIERLKQNMARLQQESKENEARLRDVIAMKGQEASQSILSSRVQELEALNDRLKLDLMETTTTKDAEIERLSRKLDAYEHDVSKLSARLAEMDKDSSKRISTLVQQVSEKKSMVEILEQRVRDINVEYMNFKEKAMQFTSAAPVVEEQKRMKAKIMELQSQLHAQATELTEKHHTLQMTTAVLREKEDLLRCSQEEVDYLQKQLAELRARSESQEKKIASLEPENSQLRRECEKLQKMVFEAEAKCRHELQAMRDRHRERFLEATAKLRSQHKTLAKRTKALEQQLAKNTDAMTALNSELQSNYGAIGRLKSSMKELEDQNQSLLEEKNTLQEASEETAKLLTGVSEAQSQVSVDLVRKIMECVEDFESLMNLAISLSEGKDPNASLLFGPKRSYMATENDVSLEWGNLTARLEQVNRLSAEIERLRTVVLDRVAVQMSSACNVQ